MFGNTGDPLEVIVTGVTKMCRAEAEKDSGGAAITALVFEEVGAVPGTHLSSRNIATTAAN